MSGRFQQDCYDEWRSRSAQLVDRASQLSAVAPDRLIRPRLDGGWSAARVLEHLILTSESYLAIMRQLIEPSWGLEERRPWRWQPRLGGRMLIRGLRSSRPLPAPGGFRPGPEPRPDVVATFVAEMHELDALLERALPLPWNALRFGSPVLWLLRLNVGDGFEILLTHAERHFRQIDRVLAEGGA